MGAVWAAVACAPAALRVSPVVDANFSADSAPVDDVIPTLAELLRAWNGGAAPDLVRVLQERLADRVVIGSSDVVGPGIAVRPVPLMLTVSLADLPRCSDAQAGVVVGDPPRVLGCGAQGLSGLAAFVVAVERHPQAILAVTDDGARPAVAASRVWSGTGGYLIRGTDGDVFELEAVDAGAVELTLGRADDDVDGLLVGLGRGLAWRSAPFVPRVLQDRDALLSSPVLRLDAPIKAWLADPARRPLVEERCHVVSSSSSVPLLGQPAARMWCQVLPGHTPESVRDGVLLAIDDPGTSVTVARRRPGTATGFGDPLAVALQDRLSRELPRAVVTPWLRVSRAGSACDAHRQAGVPCLGGVPLAVHPAERLLAGTTDDAVDTQELARMAGRVTDVVGSLVTVGSSTPPSRP
jgi:hypothetical protein